MSWGSSPVGAEGSQIGISFLARDGEQFGPDPIHLPQADLVDLVGSEIADRGAAADVVPVSFFAAWERGDGERRAAVRSEIRGNKGGKSLVGRKHFVVDHLRDLLREPLLIGGQRWCRETS